jgi:hypothetical protein
MENRIIRAGQRVPRAVSIALLLLLSAIAGVTARIPTVFAEVLAPNPEVQNVADDPEFLPGWTCRQCAVVTSTRELSHMGECPYPGAAQPASRYEVTVRMRDGSIRILPPDRAVVWRVGERMVLIGGELAGQPPRGTAANAR